MKELSAEHLSSLSRAIVESADVAALRTAASEAYRYLGFDMFGFGHYNREKGCAVFCPTLSTVSPENIDRFNELTQKIDPFQQSGVRNGKTVAWRLSGLSAEAVGAETIAFLTSIPAQSGLSIPLAQAGELLFGICLLSADEKTIGHYVAQAALMLSASVYLKFTLLEIDAPASGMVAPSPLENLSPRQVEILKWMAAGKSNTDIATILDLSKRGVDYHVGVILEKLGVATRAQAIALTSADRQTVDG